MSDNIETPVVEDAPTEKVDETPATDAPDLAAEVAKWKALSRKNEDRAKENDAAAKRLAEIDDANKSELEKIQARAEAAEKKLAEQEERETITALVAEVAKEKGVPSSVLRGKTREELEEHADAILSSAPAANPIAPSADGLGSVGVPIEGPSQITSDAELNSLGPAEINQARRDGRLKTLLG